MLPYRRLFKYRMGRYSGSYDISPKYRLIIRYSIYRSIAIPSSFDIERSQVPGYFDISSIEPALVVTVCQCSVKLHAKVRRSLRCSLAGQSSTTDVYVKFTFCLSVVQVKRRRHCFGFT